jgi:hypothetical protein
MTSPSCCARSLAACGVQKQKENAGSGKLPAPVCCSTVLFNYNGTFGPPMRPRIPGANKSPAFGMQRPEAGA